VIRPGAVVALLLALLVAATPSVAGQNRSLDSLPTTKHRDFHAEQPLQHLLSALITRPGITADSDRRALHPAINAGADAFADALRHNKGFHRFLHDLKPLLVAWNAEMATAAEGLAGAEVRGAAMDQLLTGLVTVAKQANIYPEDMDMALLQAAAAIETAIQRPPTARVLAREDRELISYLLLNSIHQARKRTVILMEPFDAMATLGTDPSFITYYAQKIGPAWARPILARELVSIEKTISDPDLLGNRENLIMMQFNTEAVNDLFYFKMAMEVSFSINQLDLNPLAAKMASMGGIMSDMTVSRLQESGAVPLNFRHVAAFYWINPSSPLTYSPDPALADRLVSLGAQVSTLPDFSLFSSPYRDIFQLRYDLFLCDLIASKELQRAEDQWIGLNQRPLSMAERLTLRKADAERRQAVMARLSGATPQEKHALRILLSSYIGK